MVVYIEDDLNKIELIENKIFIKPNNKLLSKALRSNFFIDDTLHVITVISNICEFKRRWELMRKFIDEMSNYENVKLYVVELAYDNQDFHITSSHTYTHT